MTFYISSREILFKPGRTAGNSSSESLRKRIEATPNTVRCKAVEDHRVKSYTAGINSEAARIEISFAGR
jgi:hypothetical protein